MKQISVYLTDKQLDYIKTKSTLKRVSFDEMLRQIIEGFQREERENEVKVLKGAKR